MVRFLHTSDWQIGMRRRALPEEARVRFSQARIDAIARIGAVAREQNCEFIVVAGDIFESNQLDRRTIARTVEVLATLTVHVYLVPGNHDPLDGYSAFESPLFDSARSSGVHVLRDSVPVEVVPGVHIIGAPWSSKRPLRDLVSDAISAAPAAIGGLRICVGHGAIDAMTPDVENPAIIQLHGLEESIRAGSVEFIALGDRHSTTDVGASGRIWYSGAPEPTAFDEIDPGNVLIVDLDHDKVDVQSVGIATWIFAEIEYELDSDEALGLFGEELDRMRTKDRTILRLRLTGTINLHQAAQLDELLERMGDLFAGIDRVDAARPLVTVPDDMDFEDLGLGGFAQAAVERLEEQARGHGEPADDARRALRLLRRLAGGGA